MIQRKLLAREVLMANNALHLTLDPLHEPALRAEPSSASNAAELKR